MLRYLFAVQDSGPVPDTTESHLAGPEEARSVAVTVASEMLASHRDRFWPRPDWWVQVTDEQGTTVCRITVSGTTEGL